MTHIIFHQEVKSTMKLKVNVFTFRGSNSVIFIVASDLITCQPLKEKEFAPLSANSFCKKFILFCSFLSREANRKSIKQTGSL